MFLIKGIHEGGREYQVLVQAGASLNLVVSSTKFQLADASGEPLSSVPTAIIPLTVSSGPQISPVKLSIVGMR